ncbi:hypothetical protein ACGFRB_14180 [Streptomyces sp. NPDC048718]|uniref:hypothetical protein n=1 Tax=Streptomyces sp. NPDC048718 TaxID=3365587 RepID=UPI003722357F
MTFPWKTGAAAFERILDRHTAAPGGGVMAAAWAAFEEFAQVPVEGLAGLEDDGDDKDGFIVEWGAWSWNGYRPALTLGRQLTVEGDGHPDDLQLWMVEFQAVFAENPAWAGLLGSDGGGDTGFDFAPLGSPRAEALADTRRFIDGHPVLSVMWRSTPVETGVSLGRAD